MPAPKTEVSSDQSPEASTIVESLSLDVGALGDGEGDGDGDYNALSLQQDLDLVSFQAELELDNINTDDGDLGDEYAGDVISEETVECVEIDGTVDHEEYLYEEEESILPELEDTGLTLAEDNVETMTITPSGMLRQTTISQPLGVASNLPQGQSIVLIKPSGSSTEPSLSSHIAVSGGLIVSSGSLQQIQHKLVTAKSTGGGIVQLRPANLNKPIMATGVTSSVQGIRPLQSALKRPATSTAGPTRNVYAKVVLSGNQGMQQGQPIMLATSQSGETSGQPVKIITSGHPTLGGTTRAITLAQAQQMGLISPSISPTKLGLQQILPSSPKQGGNIVVSKIMGSPVKGHPAKITMMQASSLKSPTKILPAPSGVSQLKAVTSAMVTGATTVHTTVRTPQNQQKVIIRQGPIKSGSVLSPGIQGQVIRIPSSHNLLGAGGNVAQIQMPGGRQVQYVRLVTASSSNSSPVTTTSRPRMVSVSSLSGGPRPVSITGVRSTGQSVKVVPIAPATSNVRIGSPKTMQVQAQVGQRILIPSSASQIRTITTASGQNILPSGARNITYVLPTQYVQQTQQSKSLQTPASLSPSVVSSSSPTSVSQAAGSLIPSPPEPATQPRMQSAAARLSIEANGLRPRKPCNCTKSQCLKLYCDCFANGEFCYMCNCNNCFNNLQHEEDRQIAIKSCLERNTNAFRPKIGKGHVGDERRHNKGCNCKRSGCLKNYCECYEAKISCSNNCKCVGCRNVEEGGELNALRDLADAAESRVHQTLKREQNSPSFDKTSRLQPGHIGTKPQFTFVTSAVVAATVECLAAIAEEAEANNLNDTDSERLMLEEFGRCLKEVISISDRADAALLENVKTSTANPPATLSA